MDDGNSSDPGTPKHQRSPDKSVGSSPRPSTSEPLDQDLDLSPSRTRSGLIIRLPTPKKVGPPTGSSKSKSQPKSPIGSSPTKRSLSPEHSPKKRSPQSTNPILHQLLIESPPKKSSPQSTNPLLHQLLCQSPAKKGPCTPEISIAPIDLRGPSTAPKDLPGPSTAPKDLPAPSTAPDILPAELPEELTEEQPEELTEEQPEELTEEQPQNQESA